MNGDKNKVAPYHHLCQADWIDEWVHDAFACPNMEISSYYLRICLLAWHKLECQQASDKDLAVFIQQALQLVYDQKEFGEDQLMTFSQEIIENIYIYQHELRHDVGWLIDRYPDTDYLSHHLEVRWLGNPDPSPDTMIISIYPMKIHPSAQHYQAITKNWLDVKGHAAIISEEEYAKIRTRHE